MVGSLGYQGAQAAMNAIKDADVVLAIGMLPSAHSPTCFFHLSGASHAQLHGQEPSPPARLPS